MTSVLKYGYAFADHTGGSENEVRMPIIARAIVTGPAGQHTFYAVQDHFGENTDTPTGMFKLNPSYHFRPVVSVSQGNMLYRRGGEYPGSPPLVYRELHPTSPWGTVVPIVPEVEAEQLTTRAAIAAAKTAGKPVVGRIDLPPTEGYSATIEFPISMIAVYADRWHVQAGPVLFPRFGAEFSYPTPIEYLNVAYVVFNEFGNSNYAEFLMEDALDIGSGKRVIHFWRHYARTCATSLWAVPLEAAPPADPDVQTAIQEIDAATEHLQTAKAALT